MSKTTQAETRRKRGGERYLGMDSYHGFAGWSPFTVASGMHERIRSTHSTMPTARATIVVTLKAVM